MPPALMADATGSVDGADEVAHSLRARSIFEQASCCQPFGADHSCREYLKAVCAAGFVVLLATG